MPLLLKPILPIIPSLDHFTRETEKQQKEKPLRVQVGLTELCSAHSVAAEICELKQIPLCSFLLYKLMYHVAVVPFEYVERRDNTVGSFSLSLTNSQPSRCASGKEDA